MQMKFFVNILEEYIPKQLIYNPKRGFAIPLEKWTRNDLKEKILNNLNESFFKQVPNLDIEKVQRQIEEHYSNKYDHSTNIWKLFVLSIWFKNLNNNVK